MLGERADPPAVGSGLHRDRRTRMLLFHGRKGNALLAFLRLVGVRFLRIIGSFGGFRLISYRVEQLEKKVDKHNNFAERLPVVEEQIKVINHRLEDVEEYEKNK